MNQIPQLGQQKGLTCVPTRIVSSALCWGRNSPAYLPGDPEPATLAMNAGTGHSDGGISNPKRLYSHILSQQLVSKPEADHALTHHGTIPVPMYPRLPRRFGRCGRRLFIHCRQSHCPSDDLPTLVEGVRDAYRQSYREGI